MPIQSSSEADAGEALSYAKASFLKKRMTKKIDEPLAFLKTLPSAMAQNAKTLNEPDASNDSNTPRLADNTKASCNEVASNDVYQMSEQERKETYPSDEDEDFDQYLQLLDSQTNLEAEVPTPASSTTSLKFTSYIKNPLYDAENKDPIQLTTNLSREDLVALNELYSRLKEADKTLNNYFLAAKLEKTIRVKRRASVLSNKAKSRESIFAKKVKVEDFQKELLEVNEPEVTSIGSGKFDIRKCSKDWKTQMKTVQKQQGFKTQASVRNNGYLPDWKYKKQIKAILDSRNSNSIIVE